MSPVHPDLGVGAEGALSLRVSVAALARVIFADPPGGREMVALERTAAVHGSDVYPEVTVVARPFGGAVRIIDAQALRQKIGEFRFDSDRSMEEGDFRILIRPSSWRSVKKLCRRQAAASGHRSGRPVLETDPRRELREELDDALHLALRENQYRLEPGGMFVEEMPRPTSNARAPGIPTVRVYYLWVARIDSASLVEAMSADSARRSDDNLAAAARADAAAGGRGRANGVLVAGLEELRRTCRSSARSTMADRFRFKDHLLDPTVRLIV